MLKPVLPQLATQVEAQLNIAPLVWDSVNTALPDQHKIEPYTHLMQRVEIKIFDQLFDAPVVAIATDTASANQAKNAEVKPAAETTGNSDLAENNIEALADEIKIDDFAKIDLRIAKIVNCEAVEGSDKLLRLTLDAGEGRTRNVFPVSNQLIRQNN